jgi:hypothetical protein
MINRFLEHNWPTPSLSLICKRAINTEPSIYQKEKRSRQYKFIIINCPLSQTNHHEKWTPSDEAIIIGFISLSKGLQTRSVCVYVATWWIGVREEEKRNEVEKFKRMKKSAKCFLKGKSCRPVLVVVL